MTGQQLRNSILQEAIQGRLVPQDLSNEPACNILARIRKERIELVKSGKIRKKDLDSDPITVDDIPFDKPLGWEFARLSDISLDSADGPFGSNLKKEHYTTDKQVRIIQLSNIGELGWRDSNVKYTTFEHLKNVSRSEAFAGDVIIAKMMPAGRAIICPDIDAKYVLSSDAVRFEFSSELDKHYLYYAINSPVFKDQVYGEVQGITRVRTSLNKLRTYILPIPPLEEQKRIVAKIEELLPLVDEYDKAAGELKALNEALPDKLRKSVLQEAIHGNLVPNKIPEGEATAQELLQQILKERQDRENAAKGKKAKKLTLSDIEEEPWELPEGWCWCKLKDIIDFTSSGTTKNENIDKDSWILDLEDIEKETGRLLCKKRFGDVKSLSDKRAFVSGNVLYSKLRPYLNKCIIADENGYCTTEILAFDFGPIYNRYAQSFLMSPYFVELVNQGSAGVKMPRVNNKEANEICFPLPPLSIQKAIVAKIEEVFAAIDKLK